jgi:flagellar biosynthesis anti-sigma factor FlgM
VKIDGLKPGSVKSSAKSKKSASSSRSTKSSGLKKMGLEDSVEVSDHGKALDMIRELVDASPDVRVDVIDAIVGQIKGGRYKINFEKVAEGFIKEAIMDEVIKRRGRSGKK